MALLKLKLISMLKKVTVTRRISSKSELRAAIKDFKANQLPCVIARNLFHAPLANLKASDVHLIECHQFDFRKRSPLLTLLCVDGVLMPSKV